MAERFTPMMMAVLGAWIMCVCLHEFSHALVAYWGGDRSVKERGYLTVDPTRFIDPVFSLLIPAIVLMLGGFPLPGGSVPIDDVALKNNRWRVYVSAAGPASNLILFLLFSLPLHPVFGLVDNEAARGGQPAWIYFLGAMGLLNFLALIFNLIPVPPLDGFRIIEHKLSWEIREKLRNPQHAMLPFALLFVIFWTVPQAWTPFYRLFIGITQRLGLPTGVMIDGFYWILYNEPLATIGA